MMIWVKPKLKKNQMEMYEHRSNRIRFSRKIILKHSWTLLHWKNTKNQNFEFFSKW